MAVSRRHLVDVGGGIVLPSQYRDPRVWSLGDHYYRAL
jgi:hypothetical protein